MKNDFQTYCDNWKNTPEFNASLYFHFESMVDQIPYLKHHYDVVSQNHLGFGEKAFRYFWHLIISQLMPKSRFLEIGVYKGSILCLSQMIAREIGLDLISVGLTPLSNVGDKYSSYPADDYFMDIVRTFDLCGMSAINTRIIQGLSTDPLACLQAGLAGPYNVVYIDGGHDYETVIHDLKLADFALVKGGFLVMDDASCDMHISGFKGHEDVSRAARDFLGVTCRYEHLFICGHNRVWRKA